MKRFVTGVERRALSRMFLVLGLVAMVIVPLRTASVEASSSGLVSGIVFQDYNSNGVMETANAQGRATDTPVEGVVVRAFGATGAMVGSATSSANGTYTLTASVPPGSPVRIEFSIPGDIPALAGLQASSAAAPGLTGVIAGASVQFAEVGNNDVNFAVFRPGEYCQDNPNLVSCMMLPGDANGLTGTGPFIIPTESLVSENMVNGANSALPWSSTSRKSTADLIGSVFGIGVDRSGTASGAANAYLGTYVKRHVDYGFNRATNTIYRLTLPEKGLGQASVFVTLPGTLPAHNPVGAAGALSTIPYSGDTEIFDKVGRIGLGDVDVTPNGKTLLAVDMDETAPKLWFVPINGYGNDVTAGVPVSQSIPKPTTFKGVDCPGIWHPMGLGVRGERILVGGVCGAENTVTAQTPRGSDPTASTAFVLEWNGSAFSTIFAMSLNYLRGCAIWENCDPTGTQAGGQLTAMWGAWNEYPKWVKYPNDLLKASNPQAMLSNIEIADNGDLVLNFRDRFADQSKSNMAAYTKAYIDNTETVPLAYGARADTFSAGDVLRVCNSSGALTLEADGTCAGSSITGSGNTDISGRKEFYYDNFPHLASGGFYHPETGNGSSATMPGYAGVWITGWDMSNVNQQAIISLGDCATKFGSAACYPSNTTTGYGSRIGGASVLATGGGLSWGQIASFDKGNGLADLEVLCDQAPMQIGNRIWIDTNGDGIQDADEPAVAGVTVRLYDSAGTLVGTAITDADGQYYFSSLVVEPSSGGSSPDSVGGGLVAGKSYTIRLDNPDDYGPDGPLRGYYPTTADGTSSETTMDDAIDSDATLVGSGTYGDGIFPRISVPVMEPGVNDHSFDFGFVELVAVGDKIWVDDNRNGIQDGTEGPLVGVVITLYLADGVTPATRIDGSPATTVSLADGSWVIDMLEPGDYVAKFELPPGFTFTSDLEGADPKLDSNPDPATGFTTRFTIAAGVTGDTVEAPDSVFAVYINPTIDAGVVPNIPVVVGVGDRVWIDINRDGVQDSDEKPLAGVIVTLYQSDGVTPVLRIDGQPATAVSDANGVWFIDMLAPGDYVADFRLPQGYEFTVANSGTDPTKDSNADPDTGRTSFTIAASATGDTTADTSSATVATFANLTIDIGVVSIPLVLVGMGNRVWIDADLDGVQDAGELPVAGVIVTLYEADGVTPVIRFDGTPAVAVTAADGTYFIDGLIPGEYRAQFSNLPAGYGFTHQDAGSDTKVDSNPNPATGMTTVFTIATSATGDTSTDTDANTLAAFVNLTIDAGITPLVAVGDIVWFDYLVAEYFQTSPGVWVHPINGDGKYDSDTEQGAPGVRVVLYEADGVTPATKADGSPAEAVTDASGNYVIDGLLPGTYRAKFYPPAGYALTGSLSSVPSDLNSDPDQASFLTAPFTLTAAETGAMEPSDDPTIDALFINRTIDAGLIPAMAFSGYLWIDQDRNGLSDPDEPRFPGITVFLERYDNASKAWIPMLDANGEPVAVTTGPDGSYLFDNLPIGSGSFAQYYRMSAAAPAGYEWTTWFVNTGEHWYNAVGDSYFGTNGKSDWRWVDYLDDWDAFATLNTGTDATAMFYNAHVDGGLKPLANLTVGVGNIVWIDEDSDGLQDPNEPGLAGVTVQLYEADGTTPAKRADGSEAKAVTDANGNWFIDGLTAGDYRALFTLPDGFVFTDSGVGGNGTLDSDPNPLTGMTSTFTIHPYAWENTTLDTDNATLATYANLTIDAGVIPYVSVGDYVWFDANGDGLQDSTDEPIAGVTLTITNVDGSAVTDVFGNPVSTTLTDADGKYSFDFLPFGTYVVTVTVPVGYVSTIAGVGTDLELDSSTGSATSSALTVAGQRDASLDFGFTALVAVGDVVWIDVNGDGVQGAGEPGLAGVTVQLYEADGTTPATRYDGSAATAVTNADGRYVIDGLLPGDYRAKFTLPCGCNFTTTLAGGDTAADSNADVATGLTAVFTLSAAASGDMVVNSDAAINATFINPTIDAGVLPPPSVSVGDYVWFDANGDGLQDSTDVPLAGVTLTIKNVDGSAVTDVFGNRVSTTVTDADGKYSFDFLPFGTYVVTVTVPVGYVSTIAGVGTDLELDSSTGSATSSALSVAGQRDASLDFGFVLVPGQAPGASPGDTDGSGSGGSQADSPSVESGQIGSSSSAGTTDGDSSALQSVRKKTKIGTKKNEDLLPLTGVDVGTQIKMAVVLMLFGVFGVQRHRRRERRPFVLPYRQ